MRYLHLFAWVLCVLFSIQLLYSTLVAKTVDRLHRSEVVLWAQSIQDRNPELDIPPVPRLSPEEIGVRGD